MDRNELFQRIAEDLLDNEILNEKDYPTTELLLDEVKQIIAHRMEDYIILHGKIL